MSLLSGLRVIQVGRGLAAAVAGRMFADLGAAVACAGADATTPLARHLNGGKSVVTLDDPPDADLILWEDGPGLDALRARTPGVPLVTISPYGLTGPAAGDPATDLTIFYASGLARLLTGQVDDLDEAPIHAIGEQSAFIAGLAAACAGMHAVLAPEPGAWVDVSRQEALATLAMTELTRAGQTGRRGSRKRLTDGNGATVCILPASDGYVAISPREEKQWAAWLEAMGSPYWARDPRFATKADRVAHWDALHALMAAWSRQHGKHAIAGLAQAAHVPAFPLLELPEHYASAQLAHRGFWRETMGEGEGVEGQTAEGRAAPMPGSPFGITLYPGSGQASVPHTGPLPPTGQLPHMEKLPLSGVRVLDFSWVIAGPTATRTLAAMGAEVIKVEAPGRGDPGRASELHTVLGQAKKAIVLDLKHPEDRAAARALAATADVLVENFATGVMDRLGLGAEALRAVNPGLIYVSASGLGRTGPEAHAVAYGTLLQCHAGFAGLNRHPGRPPRVGFAWLDPMLGLMLATATAAALWRRRTDGGVARVDCSMIEALLWTLAEPLLEARGGVSPAPRGNRSDRYSPHGAWRCMGEDAWISLAIRDDADWASLREVIPGLPDLDHAGRQARAEDIAGLLRSWFAGRDAVETAAMLRRAGVPAAALADSTGLVTDPHLRARGFWDAHGTGVLPGLPWKASFGRAIGPAPALGQDTAAVLGR